MVGLVGATRFCEAIEGCFDKGEAQAPDSRGIEIIDRAVLALKEFVNDLARGQANLPLRLYPAYRELMRLRGREDASEKELFFPDLTPPVPSHPAPIALAEEQLPPYLHAQRTRFQRGLLQWLREPPAGIDEMRSALDALHQAAAQLPGPRGLWWMALALLDGLSQPAESEWLKCARGLCNRIDLLIRDLAAGSRKGDEELAREVLYAVATTRPRTARMRDACQLYQLDSHFPEPPKPAGAELDIEYLEVALYDLHSRLDALKSTWVRYASGEKLSAGRFRDLVASFKAKAGELRNAHLIKLLDAIALVAARLPDPYPRHKQFMVIEMASAFLLIEHVVDHFTSPPADLDRQIVLMGGWLLDAEKGKSTGEPPAGLRPELTQQIGALQLRAHVAREIMSNLQHVEQVLDAFARDPDRRDSLPALGSYLRQSHGALAVLGFEGAAQIISLCERMVAACAMPGDALADRDMDWIAEGLSSVGFYLAPCLHGRPPEEEAVTLFFRRYEGKAQPGEASTVSETTVQLEPTARSGVDPELLAVFLDEAGEVLESIEASLPACSAQPENREALTTIRRGFHTLKGSGRMVGLMDLGEVAWEIEQLMNTWLESRRPASDDLLELIANATASFKAWIDALRDGKLAGEIDAAHIVEPARRLRHSEPPAPLAEEVTVDGVTLQRSFFDIYAKEAAQHASALEAGCAAWTQTPGGEASPEFMRAAHTLASSSRTAGFAAIADLAGAVEQWIPFAPQTREADVDLLRKAVSRLREMVAAVVQRRSPAAGDAAGAALLDLVMRLRQPAPPRLEPPPQEKRALRDDVDQRLLPIFLEEAQELVPMIGADLREWKTSPGDAKISQSLQRALHTLKGSARMAGAIRLGELTHLMESRIEAALASSEFPPALFEDLEGKMDRLGVDVERMRSGAAASAPAAEASQAEPPLPGAAAMLRVNAELLDRLINESGEVAIARSRVEAELRAVKQSLADLGDSVTRLRAQLREVEVQADSQMQSRLSVVEERGREYDPLEFDRYTRLQELTRLMVEGLNDVVSIQHALSRNAGEADAGLAQQARTSRNVQQELMRMRAVPFSSLNERLYRTVRQVARELGKRAGLEIEGAEVELDRSVLERIGAPLEHMLRNAIAHGLEPPAEREAAGKPDIGRISLTLRQESNEIALIVADDGAGLDLAKLERKGREMGLLEPGEQPSEAQLMQLVFASGLSTAEAVTEIAGRGVGMDVVRNEIAAIGGRIDIASRRGEGATFTVYLPLTLAVTQAVLVRAGATVLAVASAMVEQVLRIKADVLADLYEKGALEVQEQAYPLHYVRHLLGARTATPVQGTNSVLLVRSGIQRIAMHVDELVGNREIVVKSIGPQLARIPGVAGATVLADGAIVLIVNPVQLARHAGDGSARVALESATAAAAGAAPVVMVVDDSLTVRQVTSRLLEREGYRVVTAKDGVDALEMLKESLPAAMLVDIEMPRMDGFELARNVRADRRSAGIPIIVISSRTAEKHRAQASRLGVNAFLGKPYQEAELLRQLGELVPA
jgi:chemosensory pili system protein ChpA (sensor histidine kinase/response regulator)